MILDTWSTTLKGARYDMKCTDDLKKQADEAADIPEKQKNIEKAGMKLSDDELSMDAGGLKIYLCPFDLSCPETYPISPKCITCPSVK